MNRKALALLVMGAGVSGAALYSRFFTEVAAAASGSPRPPVFNVSLSFTDQIDLVMNHIQITSEPPDQFATFALQPPSGGQINPFNTGFESGAPHQTWAWFWPFNNPGEITVDIGAIIAFGGPWPLQGVGGQPLWHLEIVNMDYNPKRIVLFDSKGNSAAYFFSNNNLFVNLTQLP